jgi:hypothetical protein
VKLSDTRLEAAEAELASCARRRVRVIVPKRKEPESQNTGTLLRDYQWSRGWFRRCVYCRANAVVVSKHQWVLYCEKCRREQP